ncbi:uncharacterized protein LOC135138239 isoform X2 [Zophobas morio]|uniref:uncharacterized protein LOC135138239 isoform X2 n=1 Tax=Zophobas morio TaxID=2755281 RepID=UPI003082BB99
MKFKKRGGTTDKGRDYEHLYLAHLILKLTLDDDVENFYLSSNDEEFGDFDDVVVEIVLKNRTETYAIQLKHIERKTTLGRAQLTAKTGKRNFSIEKYYDTFSKHLKLQQNVKMILFTNTSLNSSDVKQLDFHQLTVDFIPSEVSKLLTSSSRKLCCHTINKTQTNSSEYDQFFENFYVYTDQADVRQLVKDVREIFKKNFMCDEFVCNQYVHFITQWSMTNGRKLKLYKTWMKRLIALCVLSPHIRPLSFDSTKSVNKKESILRDVISKFDITSIDDRNYERISHLWSNTINELQDLTEVTKINGKYFLCLEKLEVKDLFNADPSKVNKLMWLLDKCPLVVQECPQVYRTFKFCCENLILLKATKPVDEKCKTRSSQKVFERLSDLKKEVMLYQKLRRTFTYSIEGQKETALTYLLQACDEIESVITLDKLVEMLEGPLAIGDQKEVLPPSHIERNLTKILINLEFLKRNLKKKVIFVSGVVDFKSFKKLLPDIEIKEISNIERERMKRFYRGDIYISKNHFSLKQFNTVFNKNPEVEVHHCRYFNNQYLEWIRSEHSQGQRFNELKKFRLNDEFNVYTLHQSQLFNSGEQDINIICAEPGMGKSTLMKSLKTNTSSATWTIVIYARNHFTHFRENGADVEKFKEYIFTNVRKKCSNIDQQVFKAMLERNNIQVIWDGLDEVTDATLEAILTLVQTLAQSGVQQWLTSRNNLKTKLENRLGSFSRNIKQFDDEEQRKYLKERLEIPADDLTATFIKIKKNLMSFPNYEILGIPLQIYMLTELFLKDKEKYLNLLDSVFTVLDLYRHFVDEKFKVFYQEKSKLDLSVEHIFQQFEDEKETKLKCYKTVAARCYLDNLSVTIIDANYKHQLQSFLETIENKGDAVGFICRVASNGGVEFSHNSYGEYFAAMYLFDIDPSVVRDNKFISDGHFDNIRFFLDLMLCKNSKGFIAVVYKNPILLDECTDLDLDQKDLIGRDILEVACARIKNYTCATRIIKDGNFDRDWVIYNGDIGVLHYMQISDPFDEINTSIDIRTKKLLLFFPFLIPDYEKYSLDKNYLTLIVYYAIRFDFVVIFDYVNHSPKLKEAFDSINFASILSLAMYYRSQRILEQLFLNDRSYREIPSINSLGPDSLVIDEIFVYILLNVEIRLDIPNSKGQFLTHYATTHNLHKTLTLLNAKNAKWDVFDSNGRFAIHNACFEGNVVTLKLLISFGCDINIPDANGCCPIHYACKHHKTQLVQVLIDNGAKINVPDSNGQLPVHHICKRGNKKMLKLVVKNGAKTDVVDANGILPLHYACENIHIGIIEFLVISGADIDALDKYVQLLIYPVCKQGNINLLKLLIAKGADLNVLDSNGWLPLDYAIATGKLDLVNLLVTNGAKVNFPNDKTPLLLQNACKKKHLDAISFLLENGAKMDVPYKDSQLPMHYACQKGYVEVLKILIAYSEKKNTPDASGVLPLHRACFTGDVEILNLLLDEDAKVNMPDSHGNLPMHYACLNRDFGLQIMSLLLEKHADVNVPNAKGHLPIHFACEPNDRILSDLKNDKLLLWFMRNWSQVCNKAVKFLLEHDAHLDIPDTNGLLPIHSVCKCDEMDLVELLVKNGVSVNASDAHGRLPIHYACSNSSYNDDVVSFLIKNGACVNVGDIDGVLPIHLACEQGTLNKVKLLVAHGADTNIPDKNGWLAREYALKYCNPRKIVDFLETCSKDQ